MSVTGAIAENKQGHMVLDLVLKQWENRSQAVTRLLEINDAGYFERPVASGKNRGIYLLGHLIASADGLFPLFGIGERLFPELEADFLTTPDTPGKTYPSVAQLRIFWSDILRDLDTKFRNLTPADWLDRHMNVSPEDFIKEPHRNKLNVLISRTNHISYHLGQLRLLS